MGDIFRQNFSPQSPPKHNDASTGPNSRYYMQDDAQDNPVYSSAHFRSPSSAKSSNHSLNYSCTKHTARIPSVPNQSGMAESNSDASAVMSTMMMMPTLMPWETPRKEFSCDPPGHTPDDSLHHQDVYIPPPAKDNVENCVNLSDSDDDKDLPINIHNNSGPVDVMKDLYYLGDEEKSFTASSGNASLNHTEMETAASHENKVYYTEIPEEMEDGNSRSSPSALDKSSIAEEECEDSEENVHAPPRPSSDPATNSIAKGTRPSGRAKLHESGRNKSLSQLFGQDPQPSSKSSPKRSVSSKRNKKASNSLAPTGKRSGASNYLNYEKSTLSETSEEDDEDDFMKQSADNTKVLSVIAAKMLLAKAGKTILQTPVSANSASFSKMKYNQSGIMSMKHAAAQRGRPLKSHSSSSSRPRILKKVDSNPAKYSKANKYKIPAEKIKSKEFISTDDDSDSDVCGKISSPKQKLKPKTKKVVSKTPLPPSIPLQTHFAPTSLRKNHQVKSEPSFSDNSKNNPKLFKYDSSTSQSSLKEGFLVKIFADCGQETSRVDKGKGVEGQVKVASKEKNSPKRVLEQDYFMDRPGKKLKSSNSRPKRPFDTVDETNDSRQARPHKILKYSRDKSLERAQDMNPCQNPNKEERVSSLGSSRDQQHKNSTKPDNCVSKLMTSSYESHERCLKNHPVDERPEKCINRYKFEEKHPHLLRLYKCMTQYCFNDNHQQIVDRAKERKRKADESACNLNKWCGYLEAVLFVIGATEFMENQGPGETASSMYKEAAKILIFFLENQENHQDDTTVLCSVYLRVVSLKILSFLCHRLYLTNLGKLGSSVNIMATYAGEAARSRREYLDNNQAQQDSPGMHQQASGSNAPGIGGKHSPTYDEPQTPPPTNSMESSSSGYVSGGPHAPLNSIPLLFDHVPHVENLVTTSAFLERGASYIQSVKDALAESKLESMFNSIRYYVGDLKPTSEVHTVIMYSMIVLAEVQIYMNML